MRSRGGGGGGASEQETGGSLEGNISWDWILERDNKEEEDKGERRASEERGRSDAAAAAREKRAMGDTVLESKNKENERGMDSKDFIEIL